MIRLPRPASPRTLWKDIKALSAERPPHQWVAALLALAIPTIIIVTFIADVGDAEDAPEQLVYVNSWPADRSLDETRAAIKEYEERRKAAEEERQRAFQRIENGMNKLGL